MGVFSRFKDIVNANINALLDKAEDPEKMLRLMIQEMEDTLIEMKSSCAAKMASKVKLERNANTLKQLIDRWQARAELAVEKGRDDLARDALLEKKKALEEYAIYAEDLANFDEMITSSKEEIRQLEDKLNQAKLKFKMLQERARHAENERQVNNSMKKASDYRFDSLERKIDQMQAENSLNKNSFTTVEDKFRDLEEREEIERELEALKKKGGK